MVSWVRGKCIGKGAFGTVNIAVDKSNGQVFTVKSVDRKTGLPGQIEAVENEIEILRRLDSPHVISFLGDDVTCEGTTSYRNLHIEYMPGGNVADMDHAYVDELLVRRYTWCLVHALRHVHDCGVVHCDVKGRNVLLAGDVSVVKLADFGSAVEFNHATGILPRGSPMWMSPEVIRREYQGPESDVWSLGCTVIEMFTGKTPWKDDGVNTLSRIGFSGDLPEFPNALSELGRDFLEKCLRREAKERWSCNQLLQHPFLQIESFTKVSESSPRCVLDWFEYEEVNMELESENSGKGRIGKLDAGIRANWETDGWVEVRAIESSKVESSTTTRGCECEKDEERGVNWEFGNVARVEEEMEVGNGLEYRDSGIFGRSKNERVKREMWRIRRLVWRWCRNRKKRVIVGGGCRYKLDRIEGISSNYILPCKLFKSMKSRYSFFLYFNICYAF